MWVESTARDRVASEAGVRPSPEAYEDYRAYLRAMIVYLKATRPQFSYRYFSRVAGFSSPNFLKLVAEGKRNLSLRSIPKFARGLGLDAREEEIFETLVRLDQCQSDDERNAHYLKLRRRSKVSDVKARKEETYFQIHASCCAQTLMALVEQPDFKEDPAWIRRRLRMDVKGAEVRRYISMMEDIGYLERDAHGRLRRGKTPYTPTPQLASLALRNLQRVMLQKAAESLEQSPSEAEHPRALSMTLTLTEAQRRQIEVLMEGCMEGMLAVLEQDDPDPTEVYQLGIQMFALTHPE